MSGRPCGRTHLGPLAKLARVWAAKEKTGGALPAASRQVIQRFRVESDGMSPRWDASLVIRIILGLVLLGAGLSKVGEHLAFSSAIANYRLLPDSWHLPLALFLPWLEILVGLGVLGGLLFRGAALLSLGLFVGFEVFVLSALLRGLNVECGCFTGASKVSWAHAAVDLLLLVLAIYLLRKGPGAVSMDAEFGIESSNGWVRRVGVVLIALLTAGNVFMAVRYWPEMPTIPARSEMPSVPSPLSFDPPTLDFGNIPQEGEARAEVAFKNVSQQPVAIRTVSSTCGCTVATPNKARLDPGESATLSVVFQPGANRGEMSQTVSLLLEGRPDPVSFQVKANVAGAIAVVPSVVELEIGKPQKFELVAKREKVSLRSPRFESPTSLLEFKVLSQQEKTCSVEVLLTGSLPVPDNGTSVWPVPILIDGSPPTVLYIKEKGSQ